MLSPYPKGEPLSASVYIRPTLREQAPGARNPQHPVAGLDRKPLKLCVFRL
jgi:hypothetical protein